MAKSENNVLSYWCRRNGFNRTIVVDIRLLIADYVGNCWNYISYHQQKAQKKSTRKVLEMFEI